MDNNTMHVKLVWFVPTENMRRMKHVQCVDHVIYPISLPYREDR